MLVIVAVNVEVVVDGAVIVVWLTLLSLLRAMGFVLQMSFVLHTHNGISVYHTLDRVIYLTAIGFFANVNENNNNVLIEQRGGEEDTGLRYKKQFNKKQMKSLKMNEKKTEKERSRDASEKEKA